MEVLKKGSIEVQLMRMGKTLLVGNFGAGNVGDELILASALEQSPEAVVMTSDAEASRQFCGKEFETVPFPPTGLRTLVRYLFSPAYRRSFGALRGQIDQVVFPGGGLFAIRPRACWIWAVVFWWVQRIVVNKGASPLVIKFEHQGVDRHLTWFGRRLAAYALGRADEVTVRDEASGEAVQALVGKEVEVVGDRVAVNFQSSIFNLQSEKKEKVVLVNALSSFDFTSIQHRFPEHQLVFVAFAGSDLDFVPEGFAGEVVFPKNKQAVFELFEKAEYAVGERLHFLICGTHFCGAEKTFTLKAPYSEKVESWSKKKNLTKLSS